MVQAGLDKQRVMHVVLTLFPGGGAEQLVYEMVRRLSAGGSSPVVCCLYATGDLGEKLREAGITVYCQDAPRRGLSLPCVRWLAGIMKKEGVEVVHAHQYTPMSYAVPAALAAGGIKVIYTEHGRLHPDRIRWKRYLVNPLLQLGLDHIVAISESTKDAMVAIDNFSRNRVAVIHNGIDYSPFDLSRNSADKRRLLGLDDGTPVVGTAARLEEIKNLPMMLRAFRLVLDRIPECRLVIAGTGSREQELKAYADLLGIGRSVRFLGLRDDLRDIYRLFDIFLLSSFTEGVSLTLLEAMAAGLPVVVTAVGGNREVVVEGETGYLVPSGDEETMGAKVIQILKDGAVRSRLGRNGRRRIEEHFSLDHMMESYIALYGTKGSGAPLPGQAVSLSGGGTAYSGDK